ncbi:MAG: peptidylprolyl isomerase [Pseudomonadota bacterium]
MTFKRNSIAFSVICTTFLSLGAALAQTPPPAPPAQDAEARAAADQVIARSGVPSESVAAVVNDAVITTYDVRQRMILALISSGGRIPTDALPQLQQQVLNELIQDQLKLQETKKFEMEFSDRDFREELGAMAGQFRLNPEDLLEVLAQSGISEGALRQQIQAGMLWPELVQGRYRDRVRVSEREVEDTLDRMREEVDLEQFLVSEICIPVDDPSRAQQYYEGGLQLIEQMRRGVPFTVVAQQYSACTTAAVGGDVGWVRAGELPPELDNAIRELPTGAVTNPIPSEGAFMILAVRDKREAVVAGEPTFTLAYASAPEAVGENTARLAFEKLSDADACSARNLRIDLGKDIGFALLENVTLDKLDPRFSRFVEDLSRGDSMPVINADGAYHGAYVCDKDEGLGLPSRDTLESRILQRQLSRISQQYLRDLERRSAIDIRLKEQLDLNLNG